MYQDDASAIDRLTALLDDEAQGLPFDVEEAARLAQEVARIIPEVSPYMRRIAERLKARQGRTRAA
ncbi:hypothetical protein CU669_07810 [Paramagnetospirillum kuznetsovii]|uniref:Uncharacterized protein n=1 Tax=Paramagnetospirillum kuznetsovii TaxID=2053833 RepID=A0A364NZR7_9PROT|nr:hypothetical protein [Paramagnetospirillum kuznetsovii]RAU22582.1 hypothetical protein CU669_07810 [Paramagnetospirillum kuznetsovii]